MKNITETTTTTVTTYTIAMDRDAFNNTIGAMVKANSTYEDTLVSFNNNLYPAGQPMWFEIDKDRQDPLLLSALEAQIWNARSGSNDTGEGVYQIKASDQKGGEVLRLLSKGEKQKVGGAYVTLDKKMILDADLKDLKEAKGNAVADTVKALRRKFRQYEGGKYTKYTSDARKLAEGKVIGETKRNTNRLFAEKFERAVTGSATEVLKNSMAIQLTNDKVLSPKQKAAILAVMVKAVVDVQAICK